MAEFYMIYMDGKHSPTKKHPNINDALAEAKRLCEQENRKTYILRALGGFEPVAQCREFGFPLEETK